MLWASLRPVILSLITMGILACATSAESPGSKPPTYQARHEITLDPAAGKATIEIRLEQQRQIVKLMDFDLSGGAFEFISADGDTEEKGRRLSWRPGNKGGTIKFAVEIDRKRDNGAYDARLLKEWALFRGDRVFPAARVVTIPEAKSVSSLQVNAPSNWSAITPYGSGMGEWMPFENPKRRYDRPTGWIVAGSLGVRVDFIGETKVVVAGPDEQGLRRVDVLALMRWALPEITKVFGPLGPRLVIVSANDPMWRGGLSGPGSFYVHASRPLISENGTSTYLHEVIHTVPGMSGSKDADWLVEGLAEYYSVESLYRSGTVGEERYRGTKEMLRNWGKDVKRLKRKSSRGAWTARAVTLLWELNDDIEKDTRGKKSLDDVVQYMLQDGKPLSEAKFFDAVGAISEDSLKPITQELETLLRKR